jgi:hypothetical protein
MIDLSMRDTFGVCCKWLPHQLRQLRHIGRDPSRLIVAEQLNQTPDLGIKQCIAAVNKTMFEDFLQKAKVTDEQSSFGRVMSESLCRRRLVVKPFPTQER